MKKMPIGQRAAYFLAFQVPICLELCDEGLPWSRRPLRVPSPRTVAEAIAAFTANPAADKSLHVEATEEWFRLGKWEREILVRHDRSVILFLALRAVAIIVVSREVGFFLDILRKDQMRHKRWEIVKSFLRPA